MKDIDILLNKAKKINHNQPLIDLEELRSSALLENENAENAQKFRRKYMLYISALVVAISSLLVITNSDNNEINSKKKEVISQKSISKDVKVKEKKKATVNSAKIQKEDDFYSDKKAEIGLYKLSLKGSDTLINENIITINGELIKKSKETKVLDKNTNKYLPIENNNDKRIEAIKTLVPNFKELQDLGFRNLDFGYQYIIDYYIEKELLDSNLSAKLTNHGYDTSKSEIYVRARNGAVGDTESMFLDNKFDDEYLKVTPIIRTDFTKSMTSQVFSHSPLLKYIDIPIIKEFRELTQNFRVNDDEQTRKYKENRLDQVLNELMTKYLIPVRLDTTNNNEITIFWFYPNEEFLSKLSKEKSDAIRKEYNLIHSGVIEDMGYQSACAGLSNSESYYDLCRKFSGAIQSSENYPNPAQNNIKLKLKLTEDRKLTISIGNLNGTIVKEVEQSKMYSKGDVELNLNISDLSPGVYMIVINTEKSEQAISRFVVY